jgi:ribosomal protein S18 acetylase RimI-like enzyme
MNIKEVSSQADIQKTWEVMHLLRPHLNQDDYTKLISHMMDEGYKMAYVEENHIAISVIGYRHLQFLFNGRHIYIDDLSTLVEHRGKGCGSKLLDYVEAIAKEKGYNSVTLDSGCHRYAAHRLYMNKGFVIEGYHFQKLLE